MAIDEAKFVELLTALQSKDNDVRKKAETMYEQAKQTDPESTMVGFVTIIGSSAIVEATRIQAAVLLRRQMAKGSGKDFTFPRVSHSAQQQVASELLRLFQFEQIPKLQVKIGEIIACLADYVCDEEDPRGTLAPGTCGWPALLPMVFTMADAGKTTSGPACESSMRLLKDLVGSLRNPIVAAKTELGAVLQNGLAHPEMKIKVAALLIVCEVVGEVEQKDWAPLLVTAGVINQVCRQLAVDKQEDLLQEALQSLIEVASVEPDFFKQQLQQAMEPANFLVEVITSAGFEEGLRNLALEWIVTFLEKKHKWLQKHLPAFVQLALEACMSMMAQVEDGAEELQTWASRMDDEEGDEDEDELFHAGEEAIDRVADALPMETISAPLCQLVGRYASMNDWQAKHAALAAIKQTIEYVEDKSHVNAMADLLMQHLEHPHPRVRFMALHAIGQLANDQAPHFQESRHQNIMPMFLRMMDDNVDKVASMAMSAFVSFGDELDHSLMVGYAQTFMEKLVAKLQSTQHRGIREEAITSIAVIARIIEKDFSRYYDNIMPMLKQIILHAKGEKESRLRGKAFECMSLLGLAVGKDKFLPDASEAIAQMLNTQLEADDVQREYIKEASERICQCLKRDFGPFLPNLLPGIFKNLNMKDDDAAAKSDVNVDNEDDEYIQVTTGEGKLVQVRTTKFEEIIHAGQQLQTFATEMEGAYFDWIRPTAEALLPLLSASDEESYLCEEVRNVALQTWGLLIKCARTGAAERNMVGSTAHGELLREALKTCFTLLDQSKDAENLSQTASGMADCIKHAGGGVLQPEEITQMVGKIFAFMDQSFERTRTGERLRADHKKKNAVAGLGDDDDDNEDEDENEEEQLRRNFEEVLGSIMEVAPAQFLPCLPTCAERLTQWVSTQQHKVVGLYLGCDLIQHLKEQSEPVWPALMPEVFRAIGDVDPDARTAASYAVNLAAPLPRFAEAAPESFKRLAQVITTAKVGRGKRDEKARIARDNAVAAMVTLATDKAAQCPAEVNAWAIILSQLPLREDEEEAKKVHAKIVDLMAAEHAGLLGANRENLGKVLSFLAEVYRVETICEKEQEDKILAIFRSIPVEMLKGLAGGLTEKQQKKIEKMLSS